MPIPTAESFDVASDIDARLALLPIDEAAWRLCDRRERPDDASFVVAYIERADEVFDVIWMVGDGRRSHFDSMDDLLEEASRRLSASALPAATRPLPIPHFPPPQA